MTPLQQFRIDELERFKAEHPELPYPESFLNKKDRYSDKKANGLTQLIKRWLQFQGYQCERISTTGRPIDQTKVVGDVVGRKYRIGSITWIPGTSTKGSADLSATCKGRSFKIEIKIGRDVQSDNQKKYQQDIERAGGYYLIARDFNSFAEQFTEIITKLI